MTGEEAMGFIKRGPIGLYRTLDFMLSMMGSLGMAESRENHQLDLCAHLLRSKDIWDLALTLQLTTELDAY